MTHYGFPLSSTTIRENAFHLRQTRLLPSLSPARPFEPLGKNWVTHFKRRHPQVFDNWTKAMEGKRIDGTQPSLLQALFDQLGGPMQENQNSTPNIYNMDETSYATGTTQFTRVLACVAYLDRFLSKLWLGSQIQRRFTRQGPYERRNGLPGWRATARGKSMKSENVRSGWRHADIIPFNPDNVVSRAPAVPNSPRQSPAPAQSPSLSISAENREIIWTH